MTASPLLPPAGAGPGSAWLTNIGSAIYWTGTRWEILDRTSSHDPAELWEHGYRLADPHGAAAAIAVLEGCGDNARCKMLMPRESLPYGVVIEWGNSGEERTVTAWGASFLEAAQIAMLHWPIC